MASSYYERSGFRDLKTALSFRSGRFDLFSAVYLCYCDLFISADKRQYNALKEITAIGNLRAKVLKYAELRRTIFPFSGMTMRFQATQKAVSVNDWLVPFTYQLSARASNELLINRLY